MAQYRMAESLPPVVKNLLIINGVVFLAQLVFFQYGLVELYGALWPLKTNNFRIWQLITHMFMHGGIFHLIFNMFGLWMFGSMLENLWGSKRFFQFYMICGIIAGLAYLLSGGYAKAVGASGAIMGVFAAFAYLRPNTPLYLMFIPIPIKAKYAMPGLIALDVFGAIAQVPGDNIAHWAHLGGALAGLVIVMLWNRNNRQTFY